MSLSPLTLLYCFCTPNLLLLQTSINAVVLTKPGERLAAAAARGLNGGHDIELINS